MMHASICSRTTAITLAALFATAGVPLAAWAGTETNDATETLGQVSYFDGSSWLQLGMTTGSFEGPAGGDSPTARLKAGLGGPKTYFILPGAQSEAKISLARPRFRLSNSEGTARRVQLAQFEVKDESRRTTIEITKNVTVFKRGYELEVTKISDGVYEVRPKKSLQPGEYALVISEASPVADFTIVERGY